ncbi:MAG: hypothetical protein DRO05_01810 [Thermoproteota archaeon]|nr:MAG: hypothetical protein DRO05_01810 [Candidatus Korarchaeota archaeon]
MFRGLRLMLVLIILLLLLLVSKVIWDRWSEEGALPFQPSNLTRQEIEEVSRVEVTVLVDNEPSESNPELKAVWGISLYVRADNISFLFDTGPSPKVLEHNCLVLGIDLSKISFVFISHEHGDHTGGLPYVAKVAPGIPVFVPSGMSSSTIKEIERLGFSVVEVKGPTKICDGVASTGPLFSGSIAEQGLVLNVQNKGVVLLVGCAHPGVDRMLLNATVFSEKVFGVMGGFHLGGASEIRLEQIADVFEDLNLQLIAPMHCSGKVAKLFFRERFPHSYLDAKTGSFICIDP